MKKSRSQSCQTVWPYWKNQARNDTRNLLYSTTPGRSREREDVRLSVCTRQTVECIMGDGDWENRLLWKLVTTES